MISSLFRPGLVWHNRLSIAVVGLPLCLPLFCAETFARDLPFKDYPCVIYCEAEDGIRAFYFSKLDTSGVAIYLSQDVQAGMISINGDERRVGGEQSGPCYNKTVDELRSSGLAFDLPRQ